MLITSRTLHAIHEKCLFLLVFFLFPAGAHAKAREHDFRHYQVEDGLSHNTVFSAFQDRKGFMWFGTRDGLSRFDGTSFKNFKGDPRVKGDLGNNYVNRVFEDGDGQLWIGTAFGLYHYVPGTEKFDLLPTGTFGMVGDMATDSRGTLWFVMGGKIFLHDAKRGITRMLSDLPRGTITSLCVTGDDILWFCASGVLQRYDPASCRSVSFVIFEHSLTTARRQVNTIYDCRNGKLLIGTMTEGAKIFDTMSGTYQDASIADPDETGVCVWGFEHASGSEYWLAAESGIVIYNMDKDTHTNLRKDYADPFSLSDNAVHTLCKDREGGIWAGTYHGGVNYFANPYTPFTKYFSNNGTRGISGSSTGHICPDGQDNLWISTEDAGLNRLNPATGEITHYLPGKKPGAISSSNIHGLMVRGDELWIGTYNHGIDVMDIRRGEVIRRYTTKNSGLANDFVLSIFQTRSGEILAGSQGALQQYNPLTRRFDPVAEVPGYNFIHNIIEDHEGTIWVATLTRGLYYYNRRTGIRGQFDYDLKDDSSIGSSAVNDILEDRKGTIWVTTEGRGLCRLDRRRNNFIRYTTRKGWPSDNTLKVLEDGRGRLWTSTSRGLVCFDPEKDSLQVYTRANGLLSDQFNYNSGYKDRAGNMYFGSIKGLIRFQPDSFIRDTFVPPVYITGFQVSQSPILVAPALTLAYNQSSFSIDFAALSYTAPAMTMYAYVMEGLDDQWTQIETNRRVYFTGLSPGTYTFKVKAAGNSRQWGDQARMTITIRPPYWASVWAWLLYFLAAVTLICYIMRFYYRRAREKNELRMAKMEHEKNKELYHAKMEFFTNVAHEIKTPLTLIKGPLEKAIKRAEDRPDLLRNLTMMERNTDRLISLIRQLLDFRKAEAKGFSLDFRRANIGKLLRETLDGFRSLADQRDIVLTSSFPDEVCAYVDEEALNKILANLFSNAVKYAQHRAHVELSPGPGNRFTILFSNDGLLIPMDQKEKIFEPFFRLKDGPKREGTGIGLALSRSLAELHGGRLYLDVNVSDKNLFILILPLAIPADDPV